MRRILPLFGLLAANSLAAQAIGTTGIERDLPATSSWRLVYDNDFFTATDRYFTQGILLEVTSPKLGRLPLMRVLLAPRGTLSRHSVVLEDDGYTASDLKAPQILAGDHPYAGTKQVRIQAIATDTLRRQRVSSSLNLGIIGPAAGGREIQTFIHRRTGNTIPQGWGNQIHNDLILNYEAGVERELYRVGRTLLISGSGIARVGTYNIAVGGGPTVMLGRVDEPFSAGATPQRALYLYAKPQVQVVGYDATLQGGMFNRSSPYVIGASDLHRLVYRQQVGLVYRSRALYVAYNQSYATPEFRGARAHRSGGFEVGVIRSR
ncbi:MAG: lipid A deacylase LpxR family protein [Gemmatimonadota bacterium]